jgi:hypothetical protein
LEATLVGGLLFFARTANAMSAIGPKTDTPVSDCRGSFRGQSGHRGATASWQLMTQSGHGVHRSINPRRIAANIAKLSRRASPWTIQTST